MPNDLIPFKVGNIVRAPNSFIYIVTFVDSNKLCLTSLTHIAVSPVVKGMNFINRNWTTRGWDILA